MTMKVRTPLEVAEFLQVGPGGDTLATFLPNVLALLSRAGQSNLVARNTSDDVEARFGVSTTAAQVGSMTSHALQFIAAGAQVGAFDAAGEFTVAKTRTANTLWAGPTAGGAAAAAWRALVTADIPDLGVTAAKLAASSVTAPKIATQPFCRGYHAAGNQSVNYATTGVNYGMDEEYVDTDTMHDKVTNNSRITCVTAGYYLVVGTAYWATMTGTPQLRKTTIVQTFAAGGSSQLAAAEATHAGQWVGMPVGVASMVAGDYIQMGLYHENNLAGGGSPLNVFGGGLSWLMAARLFS